MVIQRSEEDQNVNSQLSNVERRCYLDTPISEAEMVSFDKFYRGFLGKRLEDKISLLKGLSLMRRGELRPYLQSTVLFQKRYENLISVTQRDLLFSYPSANKEIYDRVFSSLQSFGTRGDKEVIAKDQLRAHFDLIGLLRVDLDSLLSRAVQIIPKSKEVLAQYFEQIDQLSSERSLRFVIVIIAGHAFLNVLPATGYSTIAVGQTRDYIEWEIGESSKEGFIEFFVVGGGFIRFEDGWILLGGHSAIFDPFFADNSMPLSKLYSRYFIDHKFQLARQILSKEFPKYEIVIKFEAV